MDLPIKFPSEAEQLRRQARQYAGATAAEKLAAAADALAAAEALSLAGGRRAEQIKYLEECEREGRDRMKEFIARRVARTGSSD